MLQFRLMAWAVLPAALSAGAATAQDADGRRDWAELARRDLAFIYETLRDNHPGAVDPENPGFAQWLEEGRALVGAMVDEIDTPAGYHFAMERYILGFQDGHTAFLSGDELQLTWSAPGFAVRREYDPQTPYYAVSAISRPEVSPPMGARLVSCDGTDPETLLDERVGDFIAVIQPEARRYRQSPYLLYDGGNPFLERLEACTFMVDGEAREYRLDWAPASIGGEDSLFNQSRSYQRLDNGLREIDGADGYWITMSRLLMDDAAPGGAGAMRAVADAIADDPEKFRTAGLLVFDLRSNTGGSGSWIREIAGHVWGRDYLDAVEPRGSYTQYRVSPGNVEYIQSMFAQLGGQLDPETRDYVRTWAEGLADALARGEELWTHPGSVEEPFTGEVPQNPVRGDVYVLTDHHCASACLDTADTLLHLGATHIGLQTSGDTYYVEIRPVALPSGLGEIWVSQNYHRGRQRGWNEPHIPAPEHRWEGDIADTDALEDWVLELSDRY